MYPSVGPIVRATSDSSVQIWAEYAFPCTVTLTVVEQNATAENKPTTRSVHTVKVGVHHYTLIYLNGLQPATWYTYELVIKLFDETEQATLASEEEVIQQDANKLMQCFRTMDVVEPHSGQSEQATRQLRIAYGSCRKSEEQSIDALAAFRNWLMDRYEQREEAWPHLLLLIGDQIYADEPPAFLKRTYPQLAHGASTFEDFTLLYNHAWTKNKDVRQVLAVLPTYMIFDDHEITNNWNVSPTWRAMALRHGKEQLLIDGLVAYWVYQGWGNLARGIAHQEMPLLSIMDEAELSGEDALEALRSQIRLELTGKADLPWHYTIPTQPPIFVANARVHRTAVLENDQSAILAPTRIMDQAQMDEFRLWQRASSTGLSFLVSSVPVLLPPAIGLAEYGAGKRLWYKSIVPLRWLGRRIARVQQKIAQRLSFDHWPLYSATWQELVQLLNTAEHDVLVLSGDVHFSYAMEAHGRRKKAATLYQFVSTPLQNLLNNKDRSLIEKQARLTHLSYGGLHSRVLPLYKADGKGRVSHDLLFQNALALVTIETVGTKNYTVEQAYLGNIDGEVEVLGRTVVKCEPMV